MFMSGSSSLSSVSCVIESTVVRLSPCVYVSVYVHRLRKMNDTRRGRRREGCFGRTEMPFRTF